MIRRTLLMLLALALVAGGAACGGGGDDESTEGSSEQDDTTTSTTAADAPADSEAPPEGDSPAAEDGATTAEQAASDIREQYGIDRTFTGEGGEEFCAEVKAMQEAGLDNPSQTSDTDAAAAMAAIAPPADIAAEWTNLHEVMAAAAADSNVFATMSQEEMDEWGLAGAVVATYLGEVCGLNTSGA
jgi:hypothetical protein